ncbi:hypothetical protein TNCV_883281 [Trichonephila clavipes]|nr:hypothetical protein TNCV_883281 [Trichonephila clavipes]
MFSSIDGVTAEIRERLQQLQNLAQKYALLRFEVILRMDEPNLDQAPQDINKEESQLKHIRLQAFAVATDPGCKKELIRSDSLGLLKYIIEFKLEYGLPNVVIILRILTSTISNAICERSFSELKLIKNYLRSTMSTLRLTNLAILAIEHGIHIDIDNCIKDFAMKKHENNF